MITTALDFISSRKWLVELIVLAIVAGAVWWLCEHLIAVGVQKQKDADAKAYAQLLIDKAKEEGRLQALADQASAKYETEHQDNLALRAAQPLHGGLCVDKGNRGVSEAGTAHPGDEGPRTASTSFLPVSAGDPTLGGRGYTDIRHLLDLLAARADSVSAALREYQSR